MLNTVVLASDQFLLQRVWVYKYRQERGFKIAKGVLSSSFRVTVSASFMSYPAFLAIVWVNVSVDFPFGYLIVPLHWKFLQECMTEKWIIFPLTRLYRPMSFILSWNGPSSMFWIISLTLKLFFCYTFFHAGEFVSSCIFSSSDL